MIFLLKTANFSRYMLYLIFFYNLIFVIYALFENIRYKKMFLTLNLNIFYLFARSSEDSFLLTGKEKEQAEKHAENYKTFLRILFFLIFADMCAYTPFRFFYKQDLWFLYLFEYIYIFWSFSCLSKIKSDRWYAFPLIINPAKCYRFKKRYNKFMKSAYMILRFEKHCDVFLEELSSRIKSDYDWAGSKNIGGEEDFVKNALLQILKEYFLDKKLSASETDRIAEVIWNSK